MDALSSRAALKKNKRLVVKVGSAVLAHSSKDIFDEIGKELGALLQQGHEVVLVSSGAIAIGFPLLGFPGRPQDLPGLQASAAMGQSHLISKWNQALAFSGHGAAQILLTHADLANRKRYLNARRALECLLGEKQLPIVNENDTVSVDEIKVGDNDVLAAEICGLVSATLMILLTKADGFFTGDPKEDEAAQRIPFVEEVTEDLRRFAGPPSLLGTGGMETKLEAAAMAQRHGASTVIACGWEKNIITRILNGDDVGTMVASSGEPPERARKRWIANTLRVKGEVTIDAGAARALEKNASLLFPGVTEVQGDFQAGDAVSIREQGTGRTIGRGLSSMNHKDAAIAAGLRAEAAREALGAPIPDELIHRNDLVIEIPDGRPRN
jgi:glutamate 5-kinase